MSRSAYLLLFEAILVGGNKIIILPGKAMRRDKPELKINDNSVRSENLI